MVTRLFWKLLAGQSGGALSRYVAWIHDDLKTCASWEYPVVARRKRLVRARGRVRGHSATIVRPCWDSDAAFKRSYELRALGPRPRLFQVTFAWEEGDVLALHFGTLVRVERLRDPSPQYSTLHALLYGPLVRARRTPSVPNILTALGKT